MPELTLHGRPVETVFDLLGHDENDMTYALGWGLRGCSALLGKIVARLAPGAVINEPFEIELQEHDPTDRGFTDIELRSPELHVIVEAKRGWNVPVPAQLRRYEDRFAASGRPTQRLVILTQHGAEAIVRHQLGDWAPPAPIEAQALGWSDLVSMAEDAAHTGPLAERRLAAELATYLGEVADMRDTESNRVFVVALSTRPLAGWPAGLTTTAIVERLGRYFFPAFGAWPKTPPNYVAFRYWGRLQSIHHVDDYTIMEDADEHFPGAPSETGRPHFLLTLGPPIRPDHEVRTGTGIRRSARVWADIDLLLTSATITDAAAASRARHR